MARKLQAKFTRAGGMGCLLACLCAAPAFAGQPQEVVQPNTAIPTSTNAANAAPAPRKRSGFGQAMSQLTQALQDASRQAAARPRAAVTATPATPASSTRPAPAAVGQDTALAGGSPP